MCVCGFALYVTLSFLEYVPWTTTNDYSITTGLPKLTMNASLICHMNGFFVTTTTTTTAARAKKVVVCNAIQ